MLPLMRTLPRFAFCLSALVAITLACSLILARAGSDEDSRREAAIAEFTAKTRAANYPALFDQAAKEFRVPADVLKGIAFAETRWEHLTWPPGETVSPENGMPRPYGIMSLWDNQYFGHSLLDAATLLGKEPDELKRDPLQNIRGAAALLRKIYDENPKPADSSKETDVEGWRYAIRKYCGIPEPDLNARHALEIYRFMSQGYHQYGIEWAARPVNLDPIRAETSQIVAQEEAKRLARISTNGASASEPSFAPNPRTEDETRAAQIPRLPVTNAAPPPMEQAPPAQGSRTIFWFFGGVAVAVLFFLWLSRYGPNARQKK
jgi:hypothetical protein